MFRRILPMHAIAAALASSVAPGIADLHLPRDIHLPIFDMIRERPTRRLSRKWQDRSRYQPHQGKRECARRKGGE